MNFVYSDGGRAAGGFKGRSSDCVVRAIAIALDLDYRDVYADLKKMTVESTSGLERGISGGVYPPTYHEYLEGLNIYPVRVSSGYLKDIPKTGTYIAVTSGHLVTIVNGVAHDTFDSTKSKRTKCGSPKIEGYFLIK